MRNLISVLSMASLFASVDALAVEPIYSFTLRENVKPELCTHMEAVFNENFKNMWAIPMPVDSKLSIYDSGTQYAFPLIPGTPHSNAMTNVMMYSRIPTSPEFQSIPWLEGHAPAGENIRDSFGNPVILPYLIAYFDIDNDGVEDTVIKTMFTSGYNAMFAAGKSDAGVGESIAVYHNKRITPPPNATITELSLGSESLGKTIQIVGGFLRPFIHAGKSYVAAYDQGFFAKPTKQSRARLKAGLPPAERMFISSYAYEAPKENAVRPVFREDTLCVYEMNQMDGIH